MEENKKDNESERVSADNEDNKEDLFGTENSPQENEGTPLIERAEAQEAESESSDSFLSPEEIAELERKKSYLTKAAESNKVLLKEVEKRIAQLKEFMDRLELNHNNINRTELKLTRLAQKFNRSDSQ
eukprot:TRINITY_DN3554_c0_g1_i1.p1 TRINITY_DN3554_c0_g1~~TRINITY_DN3554_c0_g1_i1.p1  ORF type:complete len:128 (+),score=40.12 TRINITY_DN3554_c0_g1_i1:136-519(+)